MNKLCLAFFCALGVSYAIPSTTENDISTFTSPVTEKLEDSNKITTFVPSLSAIKPTISEKKSARYDGDQVLRIFTVNSKHRKKIKEIERENKGQKWASNTTSVDIYIKKDRIDEVKQALNNASMDFRILVEDVQRAIDEENPPQKFEELNEFTNRKGHRLTFEHYHRMADVHGFMDYLASARSSQVSVHTLGESVEGRPIKMIKISSGKPNASAFWIDGGIHAREWIAVASVSYIINELVENRDSLDKELQDTDFYIVPLLNPDGYEYSHESERLWRKNRRRNLGAFCVGTDLNRNWDYEWGGSGSSKFPCQEIYAGSGPLSEPETKAVANFILNNESKFKGFVTFHSYGQYILYPWGYAKRLPPDAEDLDRVGRIAAAAMKQAGGSSYSVGNSAALLYAAAGGSDDWAKGAAKIKYTYTIELRDTGRHGFLLPASHIKGSGKEAFAAIKAIAKEMNA
ncbi:carboxypeptidase B-like [Planococcus citri]|uniref:carboxypeptidase B-like n=1 Tax=Planococcus citri TaxID=170843 RepID=UPI0031F86A67